MSFEERVAARDKEAAAGQMFAQALDNAWTNAFGYKGKRPVGYRGPSKWQRISLHNQDLYLDKKINFDQYCYLHYMYCLQREYEE